MTGRNDGAARIPWRRRLGPGLITAAVVLGPGSIVASSRAGAESGYRLVWVLALAGLLMAVFTSMGARLGCALSVTPLSYVARRWGRWLAALGGVSAFLVTAGFQFGNNIGVAIALGTVTHTPEWIWPVFFTALTLFFLVGARQVYTLLERLVLALVLVMLVTFFANLFWTGFRPVALARGLVPSPFSGNEAIIGRAMLATTFSAVAAFYQAYLVQAKGWTRSNIRAAIGDARLGIALLVFLALIILAGAAQALHGQGGDISSVARLADQWRELLGPWATFVFCGGLAAASFSSFLTNALIGGTLMADGLGLEADVSGRAVKAWTAGVMLTGCAVAVCVFVFQRGGTTSLLVAQASTLIAAPLCAVLLYGLSNSAKVMGDLRNRRPSALIGFAGLVVIGWLDIELLLLLVRR